MWWRGEHTPWASCKGGFIHVNGWKKKKSSLGWDYITMFNWSMGRALMAATSTHRVFHCEGQHKHIVTLSCSLCWWMGPCFTELTKKLFYSASFTSGNTTRFFSSSLWKTQCLFSRDHNFLGNSPHPYTTFIALLLTQRRNENGWW